MKKLLFILVLGVAALGCEKSPKTGNEGPVSLEIGKASHEFTNIGGNYLLHIESNYPWTATTVDQTADWVEVLPHNSAAGSREVTIIVAPSDVDVKRNTQIRFTSANGSQSEERIFTVTQWPSYVTPASEALTVSFLGGEQKFTFTSNIIEWAAEIVPAEGESGGVEWCTITRTSKVAKEITLNVEPNNGDERKAVLRITAGRIVKDVPVTQIKPGGPYVDREVVQLQTASVGSGVDLIFMGEGYTSGSMERSTGKYVTDINTAVEHFFSVYPYNTYRNHFNVWMVVAVSNQEGMSVISPQQTVDTKFDCIWNGPGSTAINCNYETVIEYTELVSKDLGGLTVVMPINKEVYAGTCLMGKEEFAGFSIAMCPTGETFQEIVVHEAGGHGFAKLADEYIYYPNSNPSQSIKSEIDYGHSVGEMANVDMSGSLATSLWKGFAGDSAYDMVGYYEGAYTYGKGIWRPEYNSCMNDNVLYFNAQSRWAMVNRIMKLAELDSDFTVQEFMAVDERPAYPTDPSGGARAKREFVPLAPPKRIGR